MSQSADPSRPSKNNRQESVYHTETADLEIAPEDMPGGTAFRPISVEPGRSLRDEAVMVQVESGMTIPISALDDPPEGERKARPWYRVVNEWRGWYDGYRCSHIEFSKGDRVERTQLQNSYQPEYGKRYYAKLKDLERGIEREFDNLITVMLTLTASHQNAEGHPRCPADHMRDVADGWDVARKQLHHVLDGLKWEYARVWEPHKDGYGHLHIAVFIEAPNAELTAEDFRPVMESHVRNVKSAGSDAHSNKPCEEHTGETGRVWNSADPNCDDCDTPVSVNDDVNNLGSYISEYIGIFGDETLERPISEQAFYAVTWATGTRRVDFSNGAQDIIAREHFRRETGLRPSDRGAFEDWNDSDPDPVNDDQDGSDGGEVDDGETGENDPPQKWECKSICTVRRRTPEYNDPTSGAADRTEINGNPTADQEKYVS